MSQLVRAKSVDGAGDFFAQGPSGERKPAGSVACQQVLDGLARMSFVLQASRQRKEEHRY